MSQSTQHSLFHPHHDDDGPIYGTSPPTHKHGAFSDLLDAFSLALDIIISTRASLHTYADTLLLHGSDDDRIALLDAAETIAYVLLDLSRDANTLASDPDLSAPPPLPEVDDYDSPDVHGPASPLVVQLLSAEPALHDLRVTLRTCLASISGLGPSDAELLLDASKTVHEQARGLAFEVAAFSDDVHASLSPQDAAADITGTELDTIEEESEVDGEAGAEEDKEDADPGDTASDTTERPFSYVKVLETVSEAYESEDHSAAAATKPPDPPSLPTPDLTPTTTLCSLQPSLTPILETPSLPGTPPLGSTELKPGPSSPLPPIAVSRLFASTSAPPPPAPLPAPPSTLTSLWTIPILTPTEMLSVGSAFFRLRFMDLLWDPWIAVRWAGVVVGSWRQAGMQSDDRGEDERRWER